jgi:hypothetical protein
MSWVDLGYHIDKVESFIDNALCTTRASTGGYEIKDVPAPHISTLHFDCGFGINELSEGSTHAATYVRLPVRPEYASRRP